MTGEQLRQILRDSNVALVDLAAKIDKSPQSLNQALNAADVKSGLIEQISGAIEIPIHRIYGEQISIPGTMESESPRASKTYSGQLHEAAEVEYEKGKPFYNEDPVTAGESFGISSSIKPSGFIDIPGVTASYFFPVIGYSMKPEINPGDIIGVTEMDSLDTIDPDKTYMIVTTTDRMVKHLAIDEDSSDYLWAISPNYPKFKILKSDIKKIYRVTFCGKLM